MNAFDYFSQHHRTINTFLLIYAVLLTLIIAFSFLLYRRRKGSSFYAGLFYSLLIMGALLIASALFFVRKNLDELAVAQQVSISHPVDFLAERLSAASAFEDHFLGLLRFWLASILVLLVVMLLFNQKRRLAGILTGLLILVVCSLGLDYFGFTADRSYFESLNRLNQSTGTL